MTAFWRARLALWAGLASVAGGCQKAPVDYVTDFPYRHLAIDHTQFAEGQPAGQLEHPELTEASGMAASGRYPGVLWLHNDSGDRPRLFALDSLGRTLGVVTLAATAIDWEAIAAGPGPDSAQSYLYIGEIGDNNARYPYRVVYRLPEPDPFANDSLPKRVDTLCYRYPDGPRDAETLLLDPLTRDLLVLSKREDSVRVYRFAYPQSVTDTTVLEYQGQLPIQGVSDGAIAPSGEGILLRTYLHIFLFRRTQGEPIYQALARTPLRLPYLPNEGYEPQGEAITWDSRSQCYYTTSEEYNGQPAVLYRYCPVPR